MANLQIKGIDDDLYDQIKALAASQNRSVSQQVLYLLKAYLVKKHRIEESRTPARVLLGLSGSWLDDRPADQILTALKKARKNSKKLEKGF
jgi:hypothetical protein